MLPAPASPLTDHVRHLIALAFEPDQVEVAEACLQETCGAAELSPDDTGASNLIERIQVAAIKVSQGSIEGLQRAIALAHTDWRDLLMAAGFGLDLTIHKRWRPDV